MSTFKQNIILLYDNAIGQFRERSDSIRSIEWTADYILVYFNNKGFSYKYEHNKVIEENLVFEVDLSKSDVYVNNVLQDDLVAVANYNSVYGLIYRTRRLPVYESSRKVVVKISRGKKILPYLMQIASLTNNEDEKEEDEPFLASQIRKVILSKNSVLSDYLNGNDIKTNVLPDTIIFPFSVNSSQKKAVRNALLHNISIIQGPPGTGKTQSILNLLANLVYNGKSVGIVSNNNSAVENVKEKLDKSGYGFLMAHLGNKNNQMLFRELISSDDYPDFKLSTEWKLKDKDASLLKERVNKLGVKIGELQIKKEELAQCKVELAVVKRESEIFYDKFGSAIVSDVYNRLKRWNSDKLIDFKNRLNWFPEILSIKSIPLLFNATLRFGKLFFIALKEQGVSLNIALDALIYEKKIGELYKNIAQLEQVIERHDLKKMSSEYSELSTQLFNNYLFQKYNTLGYSQDKSIFDVKRFPIVLSTTYSILNSVEGYLDYIIIDESSQVDIITASLAFSACRNVVVVGDSRQLPHIVNDEVKDKANKLFEQQRIPREYDYVKNNIVRSLESLYGDSVPVTLLREHYRCNPLIIGFCNQKYYKGELVTMTESTNEKLGSVDYPVRLYRTAEGFHARGNVNNRQIAVIRDEILPQYSDVDPKDIGIISPYRNQANRINTFLCGNSGMESDTIHKFQGREKRKIIFSTVSNEITEFMDSGELINVAVSRAIDQFTMVMPANYETKHGSHIGDLIRYIEYWNPDGVVKSKIVSYFDLLNPGGHSESLDVFKLKVKGKSRFDSENIIETIVKDVLSEDDAYSGIDLRSGYPLYLMIDNKEGLSEREVSFCESRRAHVDFLLINRCDNSFVLAIEVDGYSYHSVETQRERDEIKNKVLAMNNISLLRLNTTGSREKEKIRNRLRKIVF